MDAMKWKPMILQVHSFHPLLHGKSSRITGLVTAGSSPHSAVPAAMGCQSLPVCAGGGETDKSCSVGTAETPLSKEQRVGNPGYATGLKAVQVLPEDSLCQLIL